MSKKCKCECYKCTCVKREYQSHSNRLRSLLGELQYKKCKCLPKENAEEIKYKNYHYNGSFHKGLAHDTTTGSLLNTVDYENMRRGILKNDQVLLNSVPLAPLAEVKLVNPLGSLSTILVGAPQCAIPLIPPPALSSDSAAADMVELYSMCMARDVPFIDYATDLTIADLLGVTKMNAPGVVANLLYKNPGPFTSKNIFRGNNLGDIIGPYISQLLLLNIPMGGIVLPQIYLSLKSRAVASPNRVEWGVNNTEVIQLQNGHTSLMPPLAPIVTQFTHIYNGRALAEVVHNDAVYALYFQVPLILLKLGAPVNPGFPKYANQASFITGSALPSMLCALAATCDNALKVAWYWKWQLYRKLRPEVFGLWVDNVLSGLVPNVGNYDISNVLLSNGVLADIFSLYGSYTLPLCYREGSPLHCAYPAGHSVISSACCTVVKIFFDGEKKWSTLPGVISGALASVPGVVQADATGANLVAYTDIDVANMTVGTEINKLAANVGIGRNEAGVHYNSDSLGCFELGEKIGIAFVEDYLSAMVENNLDGSTPLISFRKFNGEMYTLKYTVCKKKC